MMATSWIAFVITMGASAEKLLPDSELFVLLRHPQKRIDPEKQIKTVLLLNFMISFITHIIDCWL